MNRLRRENIGYCDIAYGDIQEKRAKLVVPCSAGGVLHDYVPFHFGPRSPMLFTLKLGNVQNFQGSQDEIIHLVSTAEVIAATGTIDFAFTDLHPISSAGYATFYDELSALQTVVDLPLMKAKYWFSNDDDPNRGSRRQAEFLVYDMMPWNLLIGIGVRTTQTQDAVAEILSEMAVAKRVRVKPEWYYD